MSCSLFIKPQLMGITSLLIVLISIPTTMNSASESPHSIENVQGGVSGEVAGSLTTTNSEGHQRITKQRRHKISIAWILFVGIGLLGLILILFTLLIGSFTKRLARKATPSVSQPDPLWHLKNRHQEVDTNANDDQTEPQDRE